MRKRYTLGTLLVLVTAVGFCLTIWSGLHRQEVKRDQESRDYVRKHWEYHDAGMYDEETQQELEEWLETNPDVSMETYKERKKTLRVDRERLREFLKNPPPN